jgi:hypothetical protein
LYKIDTWTSGFADSVFFGGVDAGVGVVGIVGVVGLA